MSTSHPLFRTTSRSLLLVLLVAGVLTGCDSTDEPEEGPVTLSIAHTVDGQSVVFDDVRYTNAAGNTYSVETAVYYLSDLVFTRDDGSTFEVDDVHYVDARDPSTLTWTVENVPGGDYRAVSFNFGLDAEKNVAGALPNTTVNNNMIWPAMMGGGYHHAKIEGRYEGPGDPSGQYLGHLGLDNFTPVSAVQADFEVDGGADLTLTMNINEVFESPNTYNFADYGPIMGNAAAQGLLAANIANAFALSQ